MRFHRPSPIVQSDRPNSEELSSNFMDAIVGGHQSGNPSFELSANVSQADMEAQTTSRPEYRYVSVRRYFNQT